MSIQPHITLRIFYMRSVSRSANKERALSLPRDLTPESVIALIDTREKKPFDLSPLRMEAASLATGDYSVKGLEDYIAVERKSLADLVLCVGRERDRFERACQRMMAYPVKAIVIEASFRDLEGGQW